MLNSKKNVSRVFLSFNDTEEAYMYANMFGLEVTDDGQSFRMPSFKNLSIFILNNTDKDTLRLRRSKIVENKFYIDHFYSNDLNNCDRLAVIISGVEIDQVKSSKFLSPEQIITSSFDDQGNFISNEMDYYLEEFRKAKEHQSVLKPLQNTQTNKFFSRPSLEIKKQERPKAIFGQDLKTEETDQQKKSQNLFSSLATTKPKTENLFESLIKKKTTPSLPVPTPAPPVMPPKIVVDMNKIAEDINSEIIDQTIKTLIRDFISSYSKISMELSDLYLNLIVKENIQNCLIEEILHQQNLKYKNEAFNRISVEIGEQILNQVVSKFCSNYFKTLITYENMIYDEIISGVFQRQFDIILKQIATEISKELFLDKLATRLYFDPENGLFNEDLLLTLHNTIYDETRLFLNVNTDLYQEIKSSVKENQKLVLLRKWRLKLSIKLLQNQHRRSLNPKIGFLLKYAAFLAKNFDKLTSIKLNLNKTVNCENYFNIINDNTDEILINIPKPVQEVNIKTVLFCSRDDILNKFFDSQSCIMENTAINLLDPREFGIRFCLKKYSSVQDLVRANSIIYTIESLNEPEVVNLKNFKHILFISLFSREKSLQFINKVLGHREQTLLCCPLEEKNFFTIDQMFEKLMRQVLADQSNRSPNLNSVNLKDLLYETVIKFLDNSKNLMIDQCLHEFSQRYWRLMDILLQKKNCEDVWPILEFIPNEQGSLKFWGSEELSEFLSKKLWNLFSVEINNQKPEQYRTLVEFKIENEKMKLGDCEHLVGEVYVYADTDLIRTIDWVEKEELNRKYSFGNMKRRISAEKKIVVVEKEKVEKSPKRLMLINEKVQNIVEDKLKPIDTNFENLFSQFQKEKESTAKFESKLADFVSPQKEDEFNNPIASSFDHFMRELNDEKLSNDKFNQKLKKILWK
ncbi:hypothetical protein BpHYR1_019482 [Brachionus plicatilis]|uniref:Uncharacterized protein n=1 Tax=Brachionus plicatilis TaxID=10195 RepID=A0A3M7RC65_BRAPC|nr:hypothetical protein BpHYR1_019482 [Brachionus plicatilis]